MFGTIIIHWLLQIIQPDVLKGALLFSDMSIGSILSGSVIDIFPSLIPLSTTSQNPQKTVCHLREYNA